MYASRPAALALRSLVICLYVGALVACVGDESQSPNTSSSVSLNQSRRGLPISGGSWRERAFIQQYARRIQASDLVDVRLLTAREDSKVIWKKRPALWLVFKTRSFRPDPRAYLRGQWRSMLIAGAVRDAWSPTTVGVRPIAGYTFNHVVDDHRFATVSAVPVQRRSKRLVARATASEVRKAIEARQADVGMEITRLEFEQTLGIAPVISVDVEDPEAFVSTLNEKLAALIGDFLDPPRIEGFYVEGHHEGTLIEASVFATRLNSSTGWVNPRYG
jgi:hypothetical protein